MAPIERLWNERNRTPVLVISGIIILVIAIGDWWTKPYVSLGFLYLFPVMFAAAFLPRWLVALDWLRLRRPGRAVQLTGTFAGPLVLRCAGPGWVRVVRGGVGP
ncbi:MAG: hypothetical protein WDO73_16520 [Ignavibacteriota bacterium]